MLDNALPLDPGPETPPKASRLLSAVAVGAMLLAVLSVYCPWQIFTGEHVLFGMDHQVLHYYRMDFARKALMGAEPHLPSWYSREFLGTPFRANAQNFPWVPVRLLLLLFPPGIAYGIGVNLAAMLAALFTFLYCRTMGRSPLTSALAGWTFACCGFFSARVMVGHLPLLEAFPALPLLLLLAEKCHQAEREQGKRGIYLLLLGLAALATALCGHPQLPGYAFIVTALYILVRSPGRPALPALGALILGFGMAAFALLPMSYLAAKSTRLLTSQLPGNDVSMPLGRLLSFVLPWADGWPAAVLRQPATPFSGYPQDVWFWDTVCYVGILPLLAFLFQFTQLRAVARGDNRIRGFLLLAGTVALVTALDSFKGLRDAIPLMLFRSPCRQLYITVFVMALALAWSLDDLFLFVQKRCRKQTVWVLLSLLLAAHFLDLRQHALPFIRTLPAPGKVAAAGLDQLLEAMPSDRRVALDASLHVTANRRYDDIGVFDSLILLRTYRGLRSLAGLTPEEPVQFIFGSNLQAPVLRYSSVAYVVSPFPRPDLATAAPGIYAVPRPSPRASFIPASRIQTLSLIHI